MSQAIENVGNGNEGGKVLSPEHGAAIKEQAKAILARREAKGQNGPAKPAPAPRVVPQGQSGNQGKAVTAERLRLVAPNQAQADGMALFLAGRDAPALEDVADLVSRHFREMAEVLRPLCGEFGFEKHFAALTRSMLEGAFYAADFYTQKSGEAKRAREEDREAGRVDDDGRSVTGLPTTGERKTEFAAKVGLEAWVRYAMAEGAVAGYADQVGKDYVPPPPREQGGNMAQRAARAGGAVNF